MLRSSDCLLMSPCGENEMSEAIESRRLLPSDPLQLHSVEEWLRGFREQQLPNLPNVVYCRKCGIHIYAFPDPAPITHHHVCGSVVTRLDDKFWQRLSNRIKKHYRKDRLLFARLNAELFPSSSVPKLRALEKLRAVPELQGPLAWVTIEWRKAAMPPGRPRKLDKQFLLGFWLHALARPQRILEGKKRPSGLWVVLSSSEPRNLHNKGSSRKGPQPPRWRNLPPIMTLEGAIQVLTGTDLKDAIAKRVPWRQPQLFGGLSIRSLTQIRAAFRKQWKKRFKDVPTLLARREAERIIVFQENIQSGGKVRVKGIKLREKPSRKVEAAGDLPAKLP